MPKKQKVRFHKGDRKPKPDNEYGDLSYKVKMKKKGFIPLNTNWFDRLFIGVISYIALQLFWMRFMESFISINFAMGIGIVWIIYVIWKG